jgi:hypothetical protein
LAFKTFKESKLKKKKKAHFFNAEKGADENTCSVQNALVPRLLAHSG